MKRYGVKTRQKKLIPEQSQRLEEQFQQLTEGQFSQP
jgi:hypothetical protein